MCLLAASSESIALLILGASSSTASLTGGITGAGVRMSDSVVIAVSLRPCGSQIRSSFMPEDWATFGVDLHLETDTGTGRRSGLERALRDAIRSGRLAPHARLPSTRALAADLGL